MLSIKKNYQTPPSWTTVKGKRWFDRPRKTQRAIPRELLRLSTISHRENRREEKNTYFRNLWWARVKVTSPIERVLSVRLSRFICTLGDHPTVVRYRRPDVFAIHPASQTGGHSFASPKRGLSTPPQSGGWVVHKHTQTRASRAKGEELHPRPKLPRTFPLAVSLLARSRSLECNAHSK